MPGALRNGAPFAELPARFQKLQELMLRRPGGDKEMVDVLALVLHHVMPKARFQHDEQVVLTAAELARSEGVATKTRVLNILNRLIDEKANDGPTIDAPRALRSCQRHAVGVTPGAQGGCRSV